MPKDISEPRSPHGLVQINEVDGDKAAVRATLRRRRRTLPGEERQERDANIQRHLLAHLSGPEGRAGGRAPVGTVAAFMPMSGEPGGGKTGDLTLPESLFRGGFRVLLPRIKPGTRELEWLEYCGPDSLQPNNLKILEPIGASTYDLFSFGNTQRDRVTHVILPALAIGRNGTRLGQGGGFYDRALAKTPSHVELLAVVDHSEILDDVPSAEHDITVHAVISDRGLFHPARNTRNVGREHSHPSPERNPHA